MIFIHFLYLSIKYCYNTESDIYRLGVYNLMKENNLRYIIETWGCQMNEEDSEKISGMLKSLGYSHTDDKMCIRDRL